MTESAVRWSRGGASTGFPLLPLLVFAVGIVLSLLLWKRGDDRLRAGERRRLEESSLRFKGAGEEAVGQLFASLERLAKLASEHPEDWDVHARQYLADHPAVLACVLARSGRDARADGGDVTPAAVGSAEGIEWLERARAGDDGSDAPPRDAGAPRELRLVGPLRASSGPALFELELPVQGRPDGIDLLLAVVHPGELFRALSIARPPGHLLAVRAEGGELFRSDGEPAEEGVTVEQPLLLPTGTRWELSVAQARPASLLERRWAFGVVVLGAGLVISILLALVVHFGRAAGSRARALALARIETLESGAREARERNLELEKRVQERTEDLQRSLDELHTFNSSISHDLRSPLGAILNFTAILNEDYRDRLDETGRECLDRIARCAEVAVSMMDSLLAFSRVGRDEIKREPLQLGELVQASYGELSTPEQRAKVVLRVTDLPDCVGDRAMIRVVVNQLLSNALKFSRKAEPTPVIEVGGYETDEECIYYVRDNGVGFDMEDARKLFGVFERLHPHGEYEGHGIGLAIARRIVQRHRGRVWAEAARQKGAAFYFSVPKERRA